jgi:hypothetical protein
MRSDRRFWFWLGGLFLALTPLLTAIAIAYFLKDAHYSLLLNGWMIVAIITFILAFACFYLAISDQGLPRRTAAVFPGLTVEISGTGSIDTEREAASGLLAPAYLRTFHARFSNPGGPAASLSVLLYMELIPGSWGRAGEAVCPPPDWTLPPALSLIPLSMPIELPAGEAVAGQLVYELPSYYLDKVAEPARARLELWDHTSGKRMSFQAAVGTYTRDDMTPSTGSAATVDPPSAQPASDAADSASA